MEPLERKLTTPNPARDFVERLVPKLDADPGIRHGLAQQLQITAVVIDMHEDREWRSRHRAQLSRGCHCQRQRCSPMG